MVSIETGGVEAEHGGLIREIWVEDPGDNGLDPPERLAVSRR